MKKNIIKYLATALICLFISLLIASSRDLFSTDDKKVLYHILADSTFIPGVLMFGIGVLVFSSNEGTFDMIAYGVKNAFLIIFSPRTSKETFYEYRQRKSEVKKPYKPLLLVGIVFIIISIVFTLLYINVK